MRCLICVFYVGGFGFDTVEEASETLWLFNFTLFDTIVYSRTNQEPRMAGCAVAPPCTVCRRRPLFLLCFSNCC